MTKIIFTNGPQAGTQVEILADNFIIGRNPDCDLVLDDGLASSQHTRLYRAAGQWMIEDLNSTNGTLLNAKPIQTMALHDGDNIQIGELQLQFKDSRPAAAAPSPAEDRFASEEDLALIKQMSAHTQAIREEVSKVIIGQQNVLNEVLMCMVAGGHALLIGLPGMAKTTMVSTLAKVLDMDFKRIQFTPDLMPADITGTDILETNQATQEKDFRFIRGPIFCHLLLADEINRTPPKTQAALLEAMQEKRVTVGNATYPLDEPFCVLATQNPIEQEGTYPLPEAQVDRFMFNIWVDYPQEHEEEKIIAATTANQQLQPEKVLTRAQVIQLQRVVRKIPVSEHVIKYAIRLVRATRPKDESAPDFIKEFVSIGAGPRAGQYLILAAKARALLEGRLHLSCQDIKQAAIPVLRHRIYTNFAASSEGLTAMDIVKKLLTKIEQPAEADYP